MVQNLVLDGLWQCLCPSFSPRLLTTSLATAIPFSNLPFRTPRRPRTAVSIDPNGVLKSPNKHSARRAVHSHKNSHESATLGEFKRGSIQETYFRLRGHASNGEVEGVDRCIDNLVKSRKQLPNIRLYSSLILVNIDPETGCAAKVSALLDEMEDEGISPDTSLSHDTLKVLAVHPDCLLRFRVLQKMQDNWLEVSADGWHDVVAGLLREKLIEQALDTMQNMIRLNIEIQSWLYDLAIYVLCDLEEVGEALNLARSLPFASEVHISRYAWYTIFDTACATLHYDAINYIWTRMVVQNRFIPSSGQCLAVLAAAARQSDSQLASDVFRVLGNRKTIFESIHYELLIEVYASAGDIRTAMTILCIMYSARLRPDEKTTPVILKYIRQDPKRIEEALEVLRDLKTSGRRVPVAAMNVIIAASIYQGSSTPENVLLPLEAHRQNVARAFEHYKELASICSPPKPVTSTFNLLFRGCHQAHEKPLAMFLAAEMLELGVKPDVLTYDRLILVCLHEDDPEDGFKYFDEMKSVGLRPRPGTMEALIRKYCERNDPKCWDLLDWAKRKYPVWGRKSAEYLVKHWKGDKKYIADYESQSQAPSAETSDSAVLKQAPLKSTDGD